MSDDDSVSSQRTYEAVRDAVADVTKHPEKRALKERSVRTKTIAHGELTADQFDKAFAKLQTDDVLIAGSGWVTVNVDATWAREAIEYVAARADEPRAFVSAANQHI